MLLSNEQIEHAKQIDLLELIGKDTALRRIASTGGGEYAGPCPFCGGKDRLRVQPKRGLWWCRQCSQKWDSAIGYVMRRDKIGFPQAVIKITSSAGEDTFSFARAGGYGGVQPPHDAIQSPPDARWQALMGQYAIDCATVLYSLAGSQGLTWLHNRGLRDEVIRKAGLGYDVPERAVTIPIAVQDTLWAVKIRYLFPIDLQHRYRLARGSRSNVPYPADWLSGKLTLVFCEGEFDTLLLWQEAGDCIDVLTFGSASAKLHSRWQSMLQLAKHVVIATHIDSAGEKCERYWLSQFPDAVCLHSPVKDITDGYCAGHDPCDWLLGPSSFLKILV